MSEEWVYDSIKCTIRITSIRAFFVSFRSGRLLWIAQSLVRNVMDVDMYNHSEEQVLEVPLWFIEKHNISWESWI